MTLQTHPAVAQDALARWWPSRYGAEDEPLVTAHA
jgi:hypothetical protein